MLVAEPNGTGKITVAGCGLYVFKHNSELGNAPAHSLFNLVKAKKNTEEPARDFSDYTITVNNAGLPQGVELLRKIG